MVGVFKAFGNVANGSESDDDYLGFYKFLTFFFGTAFIVMFICLITIGIRSKVRENKLMRNLK